MNLYDAEGNAIYTESDLDISACVKKGEAGSYKMGGNHVEIHQVFDGGLTVAYVINGMAYYNKLLSFLGLAALTCLLVCGIVMLITYKISKQISKPIHEMCRNVEKIDLEQGIHYEVVDTGIDELEFLSDSLKQMSSQLGVSLERIITLKDYETHAKMLALQAQMHPHFLFNTLTTIGTMAEESGNEKVAAMCMNLTQMFRYIASEDSKGVKMFEEIRHVERYVDIMKERFPEAVVEIDIPLEDLGCVIPKLTIQPLVENAFKYCNRKKPWISVKGSRIPDGRWQVEVQDNGPGFTHEKVCLYVIRLLELSKTDQGNGNLDEIQERMIRSISMSISERELYENLLMEFRSVNRYMENLYEDNVETRLLDYVNEHYLRIESVEKVAEEFGYNYAYLSRVFKKKVGESMNRYITEKKMALAKELLEKHPDMTLTEISEMCGYNDYRYFSRVFKAETGASPSEYRENVNSKASQ